MRTKFFLWLGLVLVSVPSACSDDSSGRESNGAEAGTGHDAADHPEPDAGPRGPCEGVTCSGHGRCVVEDGAPRCECHGGYREEGLDCVCTPLSCDALLLECGTWREPWCGATIDCGSCDADSLCLGGHCTPRDQVPWNGVEDAMEVTCQDVGWECGPYSNGLTSLDCGSCPGGATCTWNGKCVTSADTMSMEDVFLPVDLVDNIGLPYVTYGWLCLDEHLYDEVPYLENYDQWYWELEPRTLRNGSIGQIQDVRTEAVCRAAKNMDNCADEQKPVPQPLWIPNWCLTAQAEYAGRDFVVTRFLVPPGMATVKFGLQVIPNSSWNLYFHVGSESPMDLTKAFPADALNLDAIREALVGPGNEDLSANESKGALLFGQRRDIWTGGGDAVGITFDQKVLERFVDPLGGVWVYVVAVQVGYVNQSWGGEMPAPNLLLGAEYVMSASDPDRRALYEQWREQTPFDQEGNPILDDATSVRVITGSCKDFLPEEIIVPLPQPTATYSYDEFPRTSCPEVTF